MLCSKILFKNSTFYEIMSKNVVKSEGPNMTSQHGAYALRVGLARLYARMRMHTPIRQDTHVHARTHARASMHRHTNI